MELRTKSDFSKQKQGCKVNWKANKSVTQTANKNGYKANLKTNKSVTLNSLNIVTHTHTNTHTHTHTHRHTHTQTRTQHATRNTQQNVKVEKSKKFSISSKIEFLDLPHRGRKVKKLKNNH